ncbi:hypothetical protein ACFSKU_18485 [Pontibacter silvestris]|uniref:Uncharacterized protein n=1 Tax=Pontibacter silvestris TaxID=2305183 RepID=A0ABW4X1Q2_9BACT|nr:hypothetical protein [Pontibacter silvestris]MCC9135119.1 hypothetical protein [Pontibacter silvestris]
MMEKFMEYILPFLKDGYIKYSTADKGVQTVSADYFRKNFRRLATPMLQSIDQCTYYYERVDEPNLVMRFIISENAYSATLISQKDLSAVKTYRQAIASENTANNLGIIRHGSLSYSL